MAKDIIHVSGEADARKILDDDALLVVWERAVSPDLQACLDGYDTGRFSATSKYNMVPFARLNGSHGLGPLRSYVDALEGVYTDITGRKPLTNIFVTMAGPHAFTWHRDMVSEPDRVKRIALVGTLISHHGRGGEFKYVGADDAKGLDPYAEKFSEMDESNAQKLPHGHVGLFLRSLRGENDGLVHSGSGPESGVRWLFTMV